MTTDVELRTHLGVLAPRIPGPWTLQLTAPQATAVRVRVAVAEGGSATLTAYGTDATTGPTSGTLLEVVGDALTGVQLTGIGVSLLAAEVEQLFIPPPATGRLRLSRAVLPPLTHAVDVAAYADVALAGYRITWTDAYSPAVGGDYHVFAPDAAIRDGRTARVYGGVATTPPDGGVDLYAGGTTGVLPPTGVVLRLIAPDGSVAHALVALPETAFTATAPPRIWANGDQTRAFLLTGTALPSGFGRLRLQWLRDADPDLPRLSVGGDTTAESAAVWFTS